MSWLRNIMVPETRAGFKNPPAWLMEAFGGSRNSAGVKNLTELKALNLSAVYACIKVIAEAVSTLPLNVYEPMEPRGRRKLEQTREHFLLHHQPNPEMTSTVFRETLQAHVLGWGNAYAEIERNARGDWTALWPMLPDRTRPVRTEAQELAYEVKDAAGRVQVVLPARDVLHVPGLGQTGLIGYTPIRMGREIFGGALAAQEYNNRFYENSADARGVLSVPGSLRDDAYERMRKHWEQAHGGGRNAHRVAILEGGTTWTQTSINPEDAQFLETRKFLVEEIARWFNVPPHKIKHLERSTNNNIEHQGIEWAVDTVRPWLVRWEQELKRKLFPIEDRVRGTWFARFVLDALLRGDIETRYTAYASGRQWGYLSANDVRELEDMNPIPNGDMYLVPVNMLPADQVAEMPESGDEPPDRGTRIPEHRARDDLIVRGRRRIRDAHRETLVAAARRVVREESKAVRAAIEQFAGSRAAPDMQRWVNEFYTDFPATVERQMAPAINAYMLAMDEVVSQEAGVEPGAVERENFSAEYARSLGARYAKSSAGQLRSVIDESQAQVGDEPQSLDELIQGRVEEWEETRAEKVGRRETIQAGEAVAFIVFQAAGSQKKRWQTFGKNCPLCNSLQGRTITISSPFLGQGETIDAGGVSPFTARRKVLHPPLHDGCDCFLMSA